MAVILPHTLARQNNFYLLAEVAACLVGVGEMGLGNQFDEG